MEDKYLKEDVHEEFAKRVKKNKGQAVLRMTVADRGIGVNLNLYSRKYKVALTGDLVDWLNEMELKYTLS